MSHQKAAMVDGDRGYRARRQVYERHKGTVLSLKDISIKVRAASGDGIRTVRRDLAKMNARKVARGLYRLPANISISSLTLAANASDRVGAVAPKKEVTRIEAEKLFSISAPHLGSLAKRGVVRHRIGESGDNLYNVADLVAFQKRRREIRPRLHLNRSNQSRPRVRVPKILSVAVDSDYGPFLLWVADGIRFGHVTKKHGLSLVKTKLTR